MANKKPSRTSTPEIHTNPSILPPADLAVQKAAPTSNSLIASGLKPGDPLYETARAAQTFAAAAKSAATRRAYKSDWKDFSTWCSTNSLAALPADPATVALYLTALAGKGRKAATISRRVISISAAHRNADYKSPCDRSHPIVSETLQGIRRTLGTRQVGKEPVTLVLVRKIVAAAVGALAAARDRALILTGFAGGMRRSELAGMRVEHLVRHSEGITILLPVSKTDQEPQGREVELPIGVQPGDTAKSELTCPVRALDEWMRLASIKHGPVFRRVSQTQKVGGALSARSIGWVIKRALGRAGLDATELSKYGAHSLRAGFCTEAYSNGASEVAIMKQTGHKSPAMVRKYIRADRQDRQTAVGKLGL